MLVAISVKFSFKVAGTHRVPFANVRKSQADGTWKVPATLFSTSERRGTLQAAVDVSGSFPLNPC